MEHTIDCDLIAFNQTLANLRPAACGSTGRYCLRVKFVAALEPEHGRGALDQRDGVIRYRQDGWPFACTDLRLDELARMKVIVGVIDFNANALPSRGLVELVMQLHDMALDPMIVTVCDPRECAYFILGQVARSRAGFDPQRRFVADSEQHTARVQ